MKSFRRLVISRVLFQGWPWLRSGSAWGLIMANNEVMIANVALLSLGQEMITSLTQNDENARRVNAIFNQVVEELEANDWFFNRAEVRRITKDGTDPSYGKFDYRFEIPSEVLFIRGVCDQYSEDIRYEFERVGQYIHSNQSPIYLLYNERVIRSNSKPDISKMPLWFHRLISARIAYIIAPNMTENQRIRQKAELEWQAAYLSAREHNGEDSYVECEQGNNNWRYGARTHLDYYSNERYL